MSIQADDVAVAHGNHDDAIYNAYVDRVNARLATTTRNGERPLFTTDVQGLFTAYLDGFPPAERQHHNCNACRRFIERFGSLVVIEDDGTTTPAVFDVEDAPNEYRGPIAAIVQRVSTARVDGVFLSPQKVWGEPVTGKWHHFATVPASSQVYKGRLLDADQAMAEKREDFKNVTRALLEFPQDLVAQAVTMLNAEALYRSEKVLGPAQWLYNLHVSRATARGPFKNNPIWLAVATAPAGFAHPRASMVGTLLEDLASGSYSFQEVASRFERKMNPTQHQRPQAAPSAGAISAAEKLFAQLNAAGSLRRRMARLDEIQTIWTPKPPPEAPAAGGIFGRLRAGSSTPATPAVTPRVVMTWEKFRRVVLPTAEKIEYFTSRGNDSYTAVTTAADPMSPPILVWDREGARNPMSNYVWRDGSAAQQFKLKASTWTNVVAISLRPQQWQPGYEHRGEGAIFYLEGAHETRQAGLAIFPESLHSDFHGVRSVIEAFSNTGKLEGLDQPHAAGVMLSKGIRIAKLVRVTTGPTVAEYQLDRWD